MPLEILTGPDVPALLLQAQRRIGEDAVVLSVRRQIEGGRRTFEMVAADPLTAERQRAQEARARTGADALLAAEPSERPTSRTFAPDAGDDAVRSWSLAAPAPSRGPSSEPASATRGRRVWPFANVAPERRPHVVALVGPTGAGKTTTIAKLANHPFAFGGRRAGLLCLDTYRIGGVEQARQWAELSKLPFEVAWEAKDVARALRRLRDRDVVLVDTPGRGPRAEGDLRELQGRLLEVAADEVHLVMPAGLQRSLARRVLTSHLALGVTHLLGTKLDEYPDERGLFELARQFGLPMRWLADGQEVPRDLQRAPVVPGAVQPASRAAEAA
ncbi:MAG TPA: hypothetical protein VMH61_04785 [Candidatus Acidoferrales bacterium]|nr:hypothetical protein [Candidatus Acidoferrales bacterium]